MVEAYQNLERKKDYRTFLIVQSIQAIGAGLAGTDKLPQPGDIFPSLKDLNRDEEDSTITAQGLLNKITGQAGKNTTLLDL